MLKYFVLIKILALGLLFSCESDPLDKRLQKHVYYLASDSLQGRETGTKYELMAATYVKDEFVKIGLEPRGNNQTFYQDYIFLAGKKLSETNYLIIKESELEIDKDYIPLNFSANGTVSEKTINIRHDIYNDPLESGSQTNNVAISETIFLIHIANPDPSDSTKNWWKNIDLQDQTKEAAKLGAKAVVFYTCDSVLIDFQTYFSETIIPVDIPAIFVKNCNMLNKESAGFVELKVEYSRVRKMGRNVIGMIDYGADNTIIVASHHDGLGLGGFSGSIEGEDIIHNGADDAASGASVLIEFARWVKDNGIHNSNYLFISFSGEEIGLLGSMYFTNNPTINLNTASCMISLDHIGRLDPAEKDIIIYGVGTSPSWNEMLNDLQIFNLSLIRYESGIGLTDYTSFYLKNIPVLGFNTRVHEDFHSPGDEAEKINYNGMRYIYDILIQINSSVSGAGKLEFTSTIEIDPFEVQKFILRSVDYSFEVPFN